MNSNLKISQHVNQLDEAFFILNQWVNEKDLGEIRLRDAEKSNKDIEAYKKRFDILTEIFQEMTELLKGKKERVEYYFKGRINEFPTFGSLALLWRIHQFDNQLISYEDRFCDVDEAERIKVFADIISDNVSDDFPEEVRTLPDLIRYIETCSYDKETKWEIINIFYHQESCYNEVYDILSEVIRLFERYNEQIAELEQEFYLYWSTYLENHDIIETINEKIKISWDREQETMIVPLLFNPYRILLYITLPEYGSKNIIRISNMLDSEFIYSDHKVTKEEIINAGKLLSDKSKLDILEFISKRPCYGKEIAKELNLSTATISYHVSALLRIRFIKAEVNSNKVYYSIDRERITSYLEDIRNYFAKV